MVKKATDKKITPAQAQKMLASGLKIAVQTALALGVTPENVTAELDAAKPAKT